MTMASGSVGARRAAGWRDGFTMTRSTSSFQPWRPLLERSTFASVRVSCRYYVVLVVYVSARCSYVVSCLLRA